MITNKEAINRLSYELNVIDAEVYPELYASIGIAIEALQMKEMYEMQWLDDINNPLEPLKLSSALKSEIMKYEFRKEHKPKEISVLDITIMYALKKCLEESVVK